MAIPVYEPSLGTSELEFVSECVNSGWVSSSGKYIEKFEDAWSAYCGRKYGIAVCNGTAALELAVDSLGLKHGDEVLLPTFTIISCANALIRCGLKPVLVDADKETWCMDVAQIKSKITERTQAIMVVHIYGHPVDMDPILEIADKYNLKIIEDAAEAHGAQYKTGWQQKKNLWKRCGSFGDMSVFSFYANKPVTTGEGGMVLTDDLELSERLRAGRNLCFGKKHRFCHDDFGFNFRMTNLQAALGVAQFEKIDRTIARKRWIASQYNRHLKSVSGLTLPIEKPWAKNIYWMYAVVISEKTGLDADQLAKLLKNRGIETRPFFLGLHEQPVFIKKGLFSGEKYPVTEMISRQGLYLPSSLNLTESEIQQICDAVKEIVARNGYGNF